MSKKHVRLHRTVMPLALVVLLASFFSRSLDAQNQVTSPERFFGFRLGSDRQIARWDKIVEYYRLLGRESDKIKIVDMGPSTMGHPFLLLIISSSANLAGLERLREVNAGISDPRGRAEIEVQRLVREGKAVVCQTMSLHASEIGGTQTAPELAYDLLSRTDGETQRILENVIFLLVPCFNPDGAIMIADWYRKTLGTEYEGAPLPWLYHKYTGHDNNRDAFQTNMVESQYVARIMFRDWIPQAYLDHHHMGSYGPRLYVPPYAEPVRPLADPLVWREHSWYGAHIAYKEEEAGLSGVINAAQFSGWGHFGFHWITPFHNIAGMLTESADTKLATPIYIHPDQLKGGSRGLPTYEAQTTFPNPWPGGWWRLRDIVDRIKVSAWALLDQAARNKETVLWNAYLKAKRQTERGAQGKPAAYVIPADQHDPLTAVKLVNKLLIQGIEIMRVTAGFTTAGGSVYPAGSFVVSMAQPKMGLIRYLLGRTLYPDNEWTRNRDGSPARPYDMATDTMFEFMGVRVDPLAEAVAADLEKLNGPLPSVGRLVRCPGDYMFSGRLNDSFLALNLLLARGIAVRRVTQAAAGLFPGDFIVAAGNEPVLRTIAEQTGVDFVPAPAAAGDRGREVTRLRLGMYQRFQGGNMDEGWTRFLLKQFGFPYASVLDAEISKGGLNKKFDAIILPDDSTAMIMGESPATPGRTRTAYPPEYRSGIGSKGVEALKSFVEKGGVLITLGRAANLAIEKLDLSLSNITAGRDWKDLWCPGSTLRVKFNHLHPLAYGMPEEGVALFLADSPAFQILPSAYNERYETIVTFADRDLLESGWLIGEQALARKAAVVAASCGRGRVILFGIRPQHRAQTHGVFKLFFNALVRCR